MFGDHAYALVIIGGFIVLGAAIAYAKWRNMQAGKDDVVRRDAPPPSYEDGGTHSD